MNLPPLRFMDDGWVFNPFHWLGPQCRVDCYPDKLFHLLAGLAVAAFFAWGYARWRGRPAPLWTQVAAVTLVAAAKEVYDWFFAQPSPVGFWRDRGPSWRDFVATLMGGAIYWLAVWVWRALRSRRRRGGVGGEGGSGPAA